MISSNEFGTHCKKCNDWVNPYCGMEILKLTFCNQCFAVLHEALQNFILKLIGVNYK